MDEYLAKYFFAPESGELLTCRECGALVLDHADSACTHIVWHEKMDRDHD